MGTVPSFRTWVAGEIVTAAYMNGNVRDAGNFFIGQPIVQIYQATLQSIGNSTMTSLAFDASDVDTDSGHSNVTNNSRYTGKTAGWFQFGGGVGFAANATGARGGRWMKNGSVVAHGSMIGKGVDTASFQAGFPARDIFVQLNGSTDYVELQAFQTSGGNLNTDAADHACYLNGKWIHS